MPERKKQVKTGKDVPSQILQATETWLITSGYHKLSMRNIARECKISLGTLTYYFPTKESLINKVIDRLVDHYLFAFNRFLSSEQCQKDSEIDNLIEWLLKDAAKDQITRLNRELWMLSSHYPQIRRKIDDLYNTLISDLAEHLSQKYPHFSQNKLETISSLIAILTEGTCVLYGGRYRVPIKAKEMNSAVAKVVTHYLKT